jgi:hypothetical protein
LTSTSFTFNGTEEEPISIVEKRRDFRVFREKRITKWVLK